MSDVSIKVGVESSGVSSGLASVRNALDGFKHEATHSFAEVGEELKKAFAVGAVIEGFKEIFEEMSHFQNLSDKFGTSAESLQRIDEAAKSVGSDIDTVAKSMVKVNTNAISAIKGNEELASSFKTLGIDAKEFVDMPMEEKLAKLAEGYTEGGNSALKMDAVMKVLGKSGSDLIPLLAKGGDALKEMFADAKVTSDETVSKIHDTGERLEKVFLALKSYGADAIGYLLDRIGALGTGLAAIAAYVGALPQGFSAASEAFDDVVQNAADLQIEEEQKKDKQREARKEANTAEAIGEGGDDPKKAADDLAKAEEVNAKKRMDWHLASISLAERELEIRKRTAQIDAELARKPDKLTSVNLDNEKIDLARELEKNQTDQKNAREKDAKDRLQEAKKIAEERTSADIETKKAALETAKDKLKDLDKGAGFSVDSLRAIGGGLSGVNYKLAGTKDDLQRQQVDLQKQTVEQLKSAVKALEDQKKALSTSTPNGSFKLS